MVWARHRSGHPGVKGKFAKPDVAAVILAYFIFGD